MLKGLGQEAPSRQQPPRRGLRISPMLQSEQLQAPSIQQILTLALCIPCLHRPKAQEQHAPPIQRPSLHCLCSPRNMIDALGQLVQTMPAYPYLGV